MGASSPTHSFQAASARSQIPGVFNLARMDINAVNVKMKRDLGQISRQISTMASKQRAEAASTGFAVGSKSFLAVMADTTTQLESTASDVRTDAELQRQRIWYSAQLQAQQLENRARFAEVQGRVASAARMQSGIKSLIGGISRL
jgi:hypothetical protein